MTYSTSFDGAADTLLTSLPSWAPTTGYYDVLKLDGAGALKHDAYTDDPKSLMNDTGSASHYVKCVVGAGFVGSEGGISILFCATGRNDNLYLAYEAGTNELRYGTGGNIHAGSITGQSVAAGDELEVRWDAAAKTMQVKKNGTQIANVDLAFAVGTNAGTSVGIHLLYGGRTATADIFRSWESGSLAPADAVPPTLAGAITVGAKTSSTIALSWPAGSDDTAVTSYEVSSDAGTSWTDVGNVTSHTVTGLIALTSYGLRVRAKDAAGNVSAPALSTTTSTYRAGALASTILLITGAQDGNPAGFLYALAGTVNAGDWLSYRIVSGPTPAGGSLDANAMGAFSYQGPSPATLVIQPEVNGVDTAETITVTLYDGGTPDTENPVLTGAITLVSKTASSITVSCPAGTDNIGVAAYEWSKDNGSTWVSGTTSQVFSGLTASTLYQIRVHARDAAGLTSTPDLALDVTTDAAAPIVLTGASLSVTPVWTTGAIVQGVAIALSGANLAVTPSFGTGAIVQLAPVVLTGANLTLTPVFSPGALVQNAVIALQGANLVVTPVFMAGSLVEAPLYVSMAPSTTSAIYRRDANRDSNPLTVFQKSEGDVLDFDIDFKREMTITEDDARGLNPVEYQAGAGITVLGAYWVPNLKRVKLWVTGGMENSQAVILVWLNTEAGRRLQVDVRVSVI